MTDDGKMKRLTEMVCAKLLATSRLDVSDTDQALHDLETRLIAESVNLPAAVNIVAVVRVFRNDIRDGSSRGIQSLVSGIQRLRGVSN